MKIKLLLIFVFISSFLIAQNTVSGTVSDENGTLQGQVLVFNFNKSQSVFSDANGFFSITANPNDEIRFVKDGFYRYDFKVTAESFSEKNTVIIRHVEILIPEVELKFQPTGNLEKDAQNIGVSKRVAALNSKMDEYMKSPMTEAVPQNEISKTFKGHDFKAGHVSLDLIETVGFISALINKGKKPKITKPNYYETKEFISRLKSEIDLSYYRKFGMSDEGIDRFLFYAEDIYMLSKRYRKDFDKVKISNDLTSAFQEYKKINNLEL